MFTQDLLAHLVTVVTAENLGHLDNPEMMDKLVQLDKLDPVDLKDNLDHQAM